MIQSKEIEYSGGNVNIRITSSSTAPLDNGAVVSYPSIRIITIDEKSDLVFDPTKQCSIRLLENREYWFQISFVKPRIIYVEDPFELVRKDDDNAKYLMRFSSSNYVGILNMSFAGVYNLIIEVESCKIDYKSEYNTLLDKIAEISIDLITRASSPFLVPVEVSQQLYNGPELMTSKLAFIRAKILSGELERLYNQFLKKPLTRLFPQQIEEFIWSVDNLDLNNYFDGLRRGQIMMSSGEVIPLRLQTTKYSDDIDTVENRFLRFLIEFIIQLLHSYLKQANQKQLRFLIVDLEECLDRCNKIYSNPLFRNISKLQGFPSKSNVLQNQHPYKELYRIYLMLFYAVEISDQLLQSAMATPQKDLPKLYEYYCFLTIVDLLNRKYGNVDLVKSGFIQFNADKLCFVITSPQAALKYSLSKNKSIQLFYNKEYKSSNIIYDGRSYSHTLDPDISLELIEEDSLVAIIHFDAKYKLEKSTTFDNLDLDKMHAYKDAILASIGAYVLYPGKDTKTFKQEERDHKTDSEYFPSVGAFILNVADHKSSFEMLAIERIVDRFAAINEYISSKRIFNRNGLNQNYLKRLIDKNV